MDGVVIRLTGGLGNQMFQYAAGLAHAQRCGADLALDLSACGLTDDRPFHLRAFKINAPEAATHDVARLEGRNGRLRRRMLELAPWGHGLIATGHYQQPDFRFDPMLAKYRAPLLMTGLFQSERFFIDAREPLLAQFDLRAPMPQRAAEIAQRISASARSVAVHVRRGDYITNATANSIHGVCSVEYYREALSVMAERVGPGARYFLFSDEPDWVRDTFGFLEQMEIVDGHAETPWLDIHLMSLARGMITANSSFSWWGAWLGQRADKIVICPKNWVRHSNGGKLITDDLQPRDWIKLDNQLI